MITASFDPAVILQHALDLATKSLAINNILIRLGLDPNNLTYDAIFSRLLDLAAANITFTNILALIGGIFLIAAFMVRTIVPMRILGIISTVFLLAASLLAGAIDKFLIYLLSLPANVVRLVQIRRLIRKARSAAQGTLSMDWLRPYMTTRQYKRGDVLCRKGDPADEMFLTVSGKFLVSEINVEIPPDRIIGELGFISPSNKRTQSIECIEDGEVQTISYDKLLEIYFQNPEFGYYFLRLTSDRLLQNHARLEALVAQEREKLQALKAAKAASETKSAAAGRGEQKAASRRPIASILSRGRATRETSVGLAANPQADPAAIAEAPTPLVPDIEAEQRRRKALAIVERFANYSALGGFIPLPIVNEATILAVIVRMIRALDQLYDKPFEDNRAYAVAAGLVGGVMPTRLATAVGWTLVRLTPGANLVGLAVTSVTASALTRKIGRMLVDRYDRAAALEREAVLERELNAAKRARYWPSLWPARLARTYRARGQQPLQQASPRGPSRR